MEKSRMLPNMKTWNVVKGCRHDCYLPKGCWAYQSASGRLKGTERYKDGFAPALIEKELDRTFGKDHCYFVAAMGDLFGEWVPDDWILRVLDVIRAAEHSNTFLLLTKNPGRYSRFISKMPKNVILGATIETNRDIRRMKLTKAPEPIDRFHAMRVLDWPNKMISNEPIIDFDPEVLLCWMNAIRPKIVAVGYDNWKCGLPEPSLEKTRQYIEELKKFACVWEKTLREKPTQKHGRTVSTS